MGPGLRTMLIRFRRDKMGVLLIRAGGAGGWDSMGVGWEAAG